MPFIQLNNHILPYRMRRSHRAKRLQMRLMQDYFEIVAPPKIANHDILSFLSQHRHWMLKQSKKVKEVDPSFTFSWSTGYQQKAYAFIQKTIDTYCPQMGRWPSGFQLKKQKTRWGSCSPSKKIYINWLLVLAPPYVLEYVIVHELCHLFHPHHGKRFWAKVEKYFPDYQQAEKWLRVHGDSLMRAREESNL